MLGHEAVTADIASPEIVDGVIVEVGSYGGHHRLRANRAGREIVTTLR
jgi:hypothetical protein